MSDHEIYKEKVVIHHEHSPEVDAHPNPRLFNTDTPRMPEEVVTEKKVVHENIHVRHTEPYRVDHVYYNSTDDPDRRNNDHVRGRVKSEIITFRHGIYAILNVINIFLVLEFFIRLFRMSGVNPFISFIDTITYPFIAPFGSFVSWISPYLSIHWSILIAMIVYAVIAYILVALFESSIRSIYRKPS